MSASLQRNRFYKHNLSVMLIALSTVAVIYLSYDPIPAGSRPDEIVHFPAEELILAESHLTSDAEKSVNPAEPDRLSGREALVRQTRLLEKGLQEISAISDYSATFTKQEKINGVLSEPEILKVKIRQEPFSIYIKWLNGEDVGQEVAYVHGENNNRVLLKFGGLKGRMIPTLKIHPKGDLATAEARYPVTEMGLKKMIERILEFRYRDLELAQGVNCRMTADRKFDRSHCCCFEIHYDSPDVSPKFRKSYIHINKETCLPVYVKNFGWPLSGSQHLTGKKLDEATLLECYSYTDIAMEDQLSAGVFELSDKNR